MFKYDFTMMMCEDYIVIFVCRQFRGFAFPPEAFLLFRFLLFCIQEMGFSTIHHYTFIYPLSSPIEDDRSLSLDSIHVNQTHQQIPLYPLAPESPSFHPFYCGGDDEMQRIINGFRLLYMYSKMLAKEQNSFDKLIRSQCCDKLLCDR